MYNMLINAPYKILWMTVPVLIVMGLFQINNEADLQIYDTYIVISAIKLAVLFSILMILNGVVYWLVRSRALIRWMTIYQVVSAIGMIVFLMAVMPGMQMEDADNVTDFKQIQQHYNLAEVFAKCFLVWAFSQIILVVNVGLSLMRGERKTIG